MARPTTLKLEEGEVILKNLSKEKIEEIKHLLLTPSNISTTLEKVEMIETLTNDTIDYNLPLNDVAYSISKNSDGNYYLVTVQYNLESKQSVITNIKNCGSDKKIAVGEIRFAVATKFM